MRRIVLATMVMAAMTADANAQKPGAGAGPLVVSRANPRYFTIASGDAAADRAVYLTGSHIWNNLHDGMGPGSACAETPERFAYRAYLEFLKERGHNFIRLWRWEQFRSQAAGGTFHLCMTPQPWARTGVIPSTPPTPGKGDALWAWKSFLRGHHPILMDFGLIGGVNPRDPSYASFEPARFAMRDTRRYAERMKLIDMVPRGDLTSTGYALANPGKEYLVLQPSDTADLFTVALAAGTYTAEWYSVTSRQTREGARTTVERDSRVSFTSPFAAGGPAELNLKRAGR